MKTANNKAAENGGIGFVGLLTIAFIILKLTDIIDWSWWWVLSPTLISIALFFLLAVIVLSIKQKK